MSGGLRHISHALADIVAGWEARGFEVRETPVFWRLRALHAQHIEEREGLNDADEELPWPDADIAATPAASAVDQGAPVKRLSRGELAEGSLSLPSTKRTESYRGGRR